MEVDPNYMYQQQPQPYPQQQGYGNSSTQMQQAMMDDDRASIIPWLIDNKDLLTSLEHSLRNERYIEAKKKGEENKWMRPQGIQPIMNEQGINTILAFVNMRLSKIFKVSNLNKDDINAMAREFELDLSELLYGNAAFFGVDVLYIPSVVSLCGTSYYSVLKTSENGRMLDVLATTSKVTEVHSSAPGSNENKGFFGGLFKVSK